MDPRVSAILKWALYGLLAFLTFILDNEPRLARGAKFVPMQPEQIENERTVLESGGIGTEE